MKLFDDKKISILIISFIAGLILSAYLIYNEYGKIEEKDIITLSITAIIVLLIITLIIKKANK